MIYHCFSMLSPIILDISDFILDTLFINKVILQPSFFRPTENEAKMIIMARVRDWLKNGNQGFMNNGIFIMFGFDTDSTNLTFGLD